MTWSVHSDPDQYRCSCRPDGSINQPGAIPVNLTWPDDSSTDSDSGLKDEVSVNDFDGLETLGGPRRRRRDGRVRNAKRAKKTSRKTQEPWP